MAGTFFDGEAEKLHSRAKDLKNRAFSVNHKSYYKDHGGWRSLSGKTGVYAEKGGVPGYILKDPKTGKEEWVKASETSLDPSYTKTAQARHKALEVVRQTAPKPQQSRPVAQLSEERPDPNANYTVNDVTYDGTTHRPVGAPKKGYSLGPDGKMTAHKATKTPEPEEDGETKPQNTAPVVADDDEDKGDTRTNKNGLVQKGMTLGGIKDFNAAYGLEVADASKLFNLNGTNGKGGDNSDDFSAGDAYRMGKPLKESIPIKNGGATETVITAEGIGETTPYTLGQTDNPQNGVSDKPDSADLTRGLSFKTGRTGRRDPRNRGDGASEPFGGEEPSNSSLVSPMYADKARNAYRSGFLDSTAKGPMGVLRDASANQGVIRTNDGGIAIKDGDGYRTYTGDKSAREVAFDLGGGQKGYDKHASAFESISPPDKPEIQSDDEQTPATVQPEWSDMNMDQKKGAVTDFAKSFAADYVKGLKDKNK